MLGTPTPNLLEPRPKRHGRRYALIILSALALWQFGAGRGEQSATQSQPLTPLRLITRVGRIVSGIDPLFAADRDRTNVLLLGIGGAGHEGPLLTDTVILASLKPSTRQIAFLSIPRDLVLDIPQFGPRKVNHAYALAEAARSGTGGEAARETISRAFGVPVPFFVRIDFAGFEKLINDLGGITVEVERSFTDNQFPVGENELITVSFERGAQAMDGKTALRYARSRHGTNGEGSDFARARRQQRILEAIARKSTSLETITSPNKLRSLANALSRHVATNLDLNTLLRLAELAENADLKETNHAVLDDRPNGLLISTINEEGSFVLLPADGTGENLKNIARTLFESKTPAATIATARPVRVEIQNGTAIAGLAYQSSLLLRNRGVAVVAYGNAARSDYKKTVIYDYTGGAHAKELKNLAELLDAEVTATIPTWLPSSSSSSSGTATAVDFLIIVGKVSG